MAQTKTVDRETTSLPCFPVVSITIDEPRPDAADAHETPRRIIGVEDLDRLRGCGTMALRRAEELLRRIDQHCRRRHDAYVPTWGGALHRELELSISSIARDLATFRTSLHEVNEPTALDITALTTAAAAAGEIVFAWHQTLEVDPLGSLYVGDLERFTAAVELIADELAALERRRTVAN